VPKAGGRLCGLKTCFSTHQGDIDIVSKFNLALEQFIITPSHTQYHYPPPPDKGEAEGSLEAFHHEDKEAIAPLQEAGQAQGSAHVYSKEKVEAEAPNGYRG